MTEYKMTLSTTEPNSNIGIVKLRHADVNSQAIVAQIVENGQSKSFEGLQPYFCLMAQETTGQGVSEESIVSFDAKKGTLTYTASDNALQFVGRNEAYFSFRKQVGDQWVEQFSTRTFNYIVEKSIYSQPFKDSNYWWTFKELNRIFNQYIDDGKISWEEFVNQNKEILESVDPGGKILSELLAARNGKPNLKTRIDDLENETTAQLADIVTREQYISVKEFGAKGDGATNDTKAIQDAIDFAIMNGKNILINEGVYNVTTLKIKSKTKIRGIETNKTTIKGTTDSNIFELLDNNVNNFTIEHLTIDGNNVSKNCIHIEKTSKQSIPVYPILRNLYLKNAKESGIYIGLFIVGSLLENIKSQANNYGIRLNNTTDNIFINCEVFHNKICGIYGTTFSSKFTNCKCWANYGNGWTLNCGRNILVNCEAQESMGHGFEFTQGAGLECYGLISDRSGCSEGVFRTPTVKHSYGIKVTSSSGIVISGMITNFRERESGFGISELGGIYCSNISDASINLTVLNTMTNKYVAENSVYHNRVFINNKQMANTNTAIIPYVLTNGSIGEQIVNADGTFQLRNIYDALLNRYYQQLDNNGTYVARTNIIKADGGVIYGTYGKTSGFFGSDGTTRQSISTTVTDLNSAITVINSLVSILKGYGLIG